MSEILILDSSILIEDFRTGRHSDRIASLGGFLRTSSVVLAELWRGALSPADRKLVAGLPKSRPILTPTENNWIESGQVLAEIRRDQDLEAPKLRGLHFDVLIALTARTNGARLITSNRADFELIREYRDFKLEVW
jgi:predicted nucleic acid-binding protein